MLHNILLNSHPLSGVEKGGESRREARKGGKAFGNASGCEGDRGGYWRRLVDDDGVGHCVLRVFVEEYPCMLGCVRMQSGLRVFLGEYRRSLEWSCMQVFPCECFL